MRRHELTSQRQRHAALFSDIRPTNQRKLDDLLFIRKLPMVKHAGIVGWSWRVFLLMANSCRRPFPPPLCCPSSISSFLFVISRSPTMAPTRKKKKRKAAILRGSSLMSPRASMTPPPLRCQLHPGSTRHLRIHRVGVSCGSS